MPSPPVFDLDELIAPIPGASPAGARVPPEVNDKLRTYREEDNPADVDPKDPKGGKKADWPAVVELARQTLKESSKDLLVAARLTEALTKEKGFVGLRDGLRLLRRLVTECWNRVNPPVESSYDVEEPAVKLPDGADDLEKREAERERRAAMIQKRSDDFEARAAPFNWIGEANYGARFPHTVHNVPIMGVDGAQYGWFDWKQSQAPRSAISTADIEKAVQATPRERCQATVDDLTESWQELEALTKELTGKMQERAPGLTGLRQALGECLALARQILDRKGPDVSSAGLGASVAAAPGGTGAPEESGSFVGRQVASRAQVYQQLASAAALLQQLEPHSPIPYLIKRAVELGSLSFPDLMRQLIRDADVLVAMNRELGIKPPEE